MSNDFEVIYQSGPGFVKRHLAVNTQTSDYILLETIAREKADSGCAVEILPIIEHDDIARHVTLEGVKPNKNPDFRIDTTYVEVERVTKNRSETISTAISHDQADDVIINIPIFRTDLDRIAKGRFKTHPSLKSIEFRCDGTYWVYLK